MHSRATMSLRVLVAFTLVVSASTAAATSILVRNPDPIVPVQGSLQASSDLTVDNQSLTYSGVDVTGVDIAVNNTAGTNHDGSLHVALLRSDDTVLASKTTTSSFPGNTVTVVTVDFASSYSVENVSRVEVTVEETTN